MLMMRCLTLRAAARACWRSPSAPAQAADKLTVLLDWFVNPDHGPLIVARERGYLRATPGSRSS